MMRGTSTDWRNEESTPKLREAVVSLTACAVVLGIVTLFLLTPLPLIWRSTWRAKLLDLGHIPLFALFTLALVRTLRLQPMTALVCTAAVAGLGEVAQAMVHRSADFDDFLRGSIGGVIAVALLLAWKPPRSLRRILAALACAVGAMVWPTIEAFPKLWDALEAYRSFPVLCDFQTRWQSYRWSRNRVAVTRAMDGDERWVGRMDFVPDDVGSAAVVLFPVRRDWSAYHHLCCDFFLQDGQAELLISIRDGRPTVGSRRRFELIESYSAGEQHIRIDLSSLARGDEFAALDLTRVESFHLVMPHMIGPETVYLQRVWLE